MKTLLIVDDVSINRFLLKTILLKYFKDVEFNIIEAIDGREAIELAKEKKPDIILMDYSMPNMNGGESANIIKTKINENVIIVLVSSYDYDYIINDGVSPEHIDGFVRKPVLLDNLKQEINKYVYG